MTDIAGFSHVSLTVTNLESSKEWYSRVLEWQHIIDGEASGTRYSFGYLPGGAGLGLREHEGGPRDRFNERRTGLDHLSFSVASGSALEEWERRLAQHGVTYTPAQDAPYGRVLSFRDPDNVALELFAMPGT